MAEKQRAMKKKLINWLTARVDACLQSAAWQQYKAEQARAEAYLDRANSYEIQLASAQRALQQGHELFQELYG